jgi:cytidine deaminase
MTELQAAKAELLEVLENVARESQSRAYAPYSNYRVGAAIVTAKGTVFGGCNVENASFGATICAERSAIAQMVAAGEKDPVACAIVTDGATPAPPCGMCRQVLIEFAEDMHIFSVVGKGRAKRTTEWALADLLPGAFGRAFLKEASEAAPASKPARAVEPAKRKPGKAATGKATLTRKTSKTSKR